MPLQLVRKDVPGVQYGHHSRISKKSEPSHRDKEKDGSITNQQLSGQEADLNLVGGCQI